MDAQKKHLLETLLIEFQNELAQISLNNGYNENYRYECIENYKDILKVLIVIQNH